jgi:hypothetical protein
VLSSAISRATCSICAVTSARSCGDNTISRKKGWRPRFPADLPPQSAAHCAPASEPVRRTNQHDERS